MTSHLILSGNLWLQGRLTDATASTWQKRHLKICERSYREMESCQEIRRSFIVPPESGKTVQHHAAEVNTDHRLTQLKGFVKLTERFEFGLKLYEHHSRVHCQRTNWLNLVKTWAASQNIISSSNVPLYKLKKKKSPFREKYKEIGLFISF